MRIDRPGLVLSLGLTVALSACGSVLQEPPDGGRDGGLVPCDDLGEAACRLRSDCAVDGCAACTGGGFSFLGCRDLAGGPRVACGACPPPCSSLTDETSCKEFPGCRANYCANCAPGGQSFSGCVDASDPTNICPTIACPAPCASMTTRDSCEARPDCHAVFVDDGLCGCAALGCCARFSRCADGGTAMCIQPPIVCDAVAPHCEGPYVVGYAGSCYEGCVLASDCIVL
jgi:hypothetical protein